MNAKPRFIVDWSRAIHGLADALATYFPSLNGWRVTRAEQIAAELLGDDPERNGRPLAEGLYRLVVSPLVFIYEIGAESNIVRIRSVGHFPV